VVVTSDNPRSEPPDQIIADILSGIPHLSEWEGRLYRESDRARAIELAIQLAQPGDVVLIAGKGHETYQLFADRRVPFDDREQARLALRRRLAS
ncbi:MAG TPA: UDP-N-acetylmuramoyl-L-alanyl-D-glutamate--2,6-diaminopimelate ligase, partial [Burkholderiales bacterium]|nr:UDP-N-acetylmuramoyl-L-alanyl-D-glutamate--2,6-diaminopimelate ligase [Burkholderiales bacterium]